MLFVNVLFYIKRLLIVYYVVPGLVGCKSSSLNKLDYTQGRPNIMSGAVYRVICQFNNMICFSKNFLEWYEINVKVDICIPEVMIFCLSF